MTVQELIDELEKVEDKSREMWVFTLMTTLPLVNIKEFDTSTVGKVVYLQTYIP